MSCESRRNWSPVFAPCLSPIVSAALTVPLSDMRSKIKRSQSSPGNSRLSSLSNDSASECDRRNILSVDETFPDMFSSTDHLNASNYHAAVDHRRRDRVSPSILSQAVRASPKSQPLSRTMHTSDFRSQHSSAPNSGSKSWLNMSLNKFSQISLSATWAGQAFLSSKSSPVSIFEGDGMDVLRLCPEEVASQLTMIDLPIFKSIQESEFLSIGWNTARKKTAAPNIVNFTRRFNQVSFWVIEEILLSTTNRKSSNSSNQNNKNNSNNHLLTSSLANGFSPKSKWSSSASMDWDTKTRSEVIVCFIKIARKLFDLNNLHSCYAIISALNSAPIYRLYKSWPYVNRKERSAFDRLSNLFNDDCNFENLRNHLSKTDLPCIPYLGMFLRDLVFVDIAHPASSGRVETINHREVKMGRILESVMKYQKSFYNIDIIPALHDYLLSCRYIEELQKFLEDDNFKLSLRLEPPPKHDPHSQQSNGKVKKSSSKFYISSAEIQEEQDHDAPECNVLEQSLPANGIKSFVPSHRKSRSLGSNALLDSLSMTVKPVSLEEKSANVSRKTSIQSCMESDPTRTRRLIDDSVMEEESEECTDSQYTPPRRVSVDFSIGDGRIIHRERGTGNVVPNLHVDQVPLIRIIENPLLGEKKERKNVMPQSETGIMFEGYVKRKTILKEGKKPAFSLWIRYWLILRSNHVLYFHPAKSVHGCSKDHFRKRNSKSTQMTGDWLAMPVLNEDDSFTLTDASRGNIYLFKANGSEEASHWCQSLSGVQQSLKPDSSGSENQYRNRSVTASPCLTFVI